MKRFVTPCFLLSITLILFSCSSTKEPETTPPAQVEAPPPEPTPPTPRPKVEVIIVKNIADKIIAGDWYTEFVTSHRRKPSVFISTMILPENLFPDEFSGPFLESLRASDKFDLSPAQETADILLLPTISTSSENPGETIYTLDIKLTNRLSNRYLFNIEKSIRLIKQHPQKESTTEIQPPGISEPKEATSDTSTTN